MGQKKQVYSLQFLWKGRHNTGVYDASQKWALRPGARNGAVPMRFVSLSQGSSVWVLRRGGCPAWILVQGLCCIYLEKNICTHCFSMRYYWFLVFTFAIPTVQLNTPKDPRKMMSPSLVFHYRRATWDKFWAAMFRAVSYKAVLGITQFILSCTWVISDCFYDFGYTALNIVCVSQYIYTWAIKFLAL